MKDILLTADGDRLVNETGDISITDSVRQAVRIRLLWFLNEWRFTPQYGVPYFEDILTKNPSRERVKGIIRRETVSVDEVLDARNISLVINKPAREAKISLDIVTAEETYREEMGIHV